MADHLRSRGRWIRRVAFMLVAAFALEFGVNVVVFNVEWRRANVFTFEDLGEPIPLSAHRDAVWRDHRPASFDGRVPVAVGQSSVYGDHESIHDTIRTANRQAVKRFTMDAVTAGYPFRAHDATRWEAESFGAGVRRVTMSGTDSLSVGDIVVPTRIASWPALAGNVGAALVVVAVGYAALLGLVAVRRARRMRRGCCPRCAYRLAVREGGALCSECGWEGER